MYVGYDLEKLYGLEWHYRIIELERMGYYLKIKILSAQRPALVKMRRTLGSDVVVDLVPTRHGVCILDAQSFCI